MFWDLLIPLSSDYALISSSLRGRVSGFASDSGKVWTCLESLVFMCVCTCVCVCMGGQCNDTIVKYSRLKTPKVDFSSNFRRDFRELILEMICRNELSWEVWLLRKIIKLQQGWGWQCRPGTGYEGPILSLVSWAFYGWFRQGNFTRPDHSGDITLVVTSRMKTNLREMMPLLGHQVTCTVDWWLYY